MELKKDGLRDNQKVYDLPALKAMPPISRSMFDAAARDASQVIFEMLDMEYDDVLLSDFLKTTDGKKMEASIARLLSYINERKIANLDRAAFK